MTTLTNNSDVYVADGGEVVYALGGDDIIYVIPTNDSNPFQQDFDYFTGGTIYGNQGNDTIYGSDADFGDILHGDSGNDTIYGNGNEDWCYGESGNDIISTGWGDDFVDGGSGDDTVYATEATSTDILHGGDGYDKLYLYHDINETWNFSLIGQGSTLGLVATGFEELHFSGGAGAEVIEGGNNGDWMWGDD